MPIPCHVCKKNIPENQSWFEGHGKKVCLSCFRTYNKCSKCKFPLVKTRLKKGLEHLCEFCSAGKEVKSGHLCLYCEEDIGYSSSHYTGHNKFVCQSCYKNIKNRCFLCGFPVKTPGTMKDPVCSFCLDLSLPTEGMIGLKHSLKEYLLKFKVQLPDRDPEFTKFDWKILAGMQTNKDLTAQVTRINQMALYVYPVFYLKKRFYTLPHISSDWFIPFFVIQLVAWSVCEKYKLQDLTGDTPFHFLARGWGHWIGLLTAKNLKYKEPELLLKRFQNLDAAGDFNKIAAMSEYRDLSEIVQYVSENLESFALRYL